jgi:DNA repair exonuclease SbcCD ATPase subunit
MLVWDMNTHTSEFVEIKNEYGFFTIDVEDGEIITDLSNFPQKCNLRIRTNDSKETDIKIIISHLKKNYNILDYTVIGNQLNSLNESSEINNFYLDELNNVHHQNNIIKEYIKNTFLDIKKNTLNNVLKINEKLNAQLSPADKTANIKWSPVYFKFSNMFSYGESNTIDFTSLNGIYGLFAPNAAGKSSVFDAISFCLYDKCSRTFKAEEVLNNQKNEFTSEFCFLFEDKKYYVQRNAKRQKAGNVKVYVEFYTYENDTKISLNGEHRRDTNTIIRQYLGSYEDFIFTSLSIQGNNSVFINKSQSERKDLLAQLMGLDIFDSLANLATEEIKETKALLNNFKKNDFTSELAELTQKLDDKKDELANLEQLESKHTSEVAKYDNKIESQLLNLYDVDDTLSEQKLLSELDQIKKTITSSETKKKKTLDEINKLYSQEAEISDQLNELEDIQTEFESFLIKENQYNELLQSKSKIISKIDQLNDTIKRTKDNLEFDVNDQCESCLNNIKKFNDEYEELLQYLADRNNDLTKIESEINNIELDYSIKDRYNQYSKLSSDTNKINQSIQIKESNVDVLLSQLNSLNNEKDTVENKLEQLKQNEEKIQTNRQTKLRIEILKDEKEKINKLLTQVRTEIKATHSTIGYIENKISTIKQNIKETKALEKEYQAYEIYLDCVKRDGIPYDIITKSVSKIQAEINNILKQIVEFSIAIEIDGKNINAKLVYEDKEWPLEMGSGMEKFICGVAIRIALMNISKLSKPNFMVLDEGFGVLDSDNLNSVYSLFQYMKSYFKFIIIISHLDGMRDVVDNFIEISKDGGYSKIHHQ